ncbi:MAG: GHKL domain-containing protein [Clostridia bacterium]|nr:GHKL domain-containing protein [Clostridia bacterium]
MIQFLNNIWIALSSENVELVNLLSLPLFPVENFILMNLFLVILNVKTTLREKLLYVFAMSIISAISSYFIPSPINVLLNYTCMLFFIKIIFHLNLLKSFLSLIISIFIFGVLNVLIQNPYLIILNIEPNIFISTPLYRIPYLIIVYTSLFLICLIIKHLNFSKLNLELLDNLDKKTLVLLIINLLLGFLTLCIQLITTTFYIDIVPLIISVLNFVLLIAFLILSIYSITRVIKLSNTRKELASAEEYNRSLQILYDEVKGFKHDFDNIVSTIYGYIENNDMPGLKQYFHGVKKDCKFTNDLSILNPSTINNPGLYSLLNNKYFKAINLGICFEIEYFLNLDNLDVNMYQFSRILGILIDNAMEEAEKCEKKIVKVSFIRQNKNNRNIITIENTYSNKDVDLEKIFEKGKSGKENHSGIGLWEVKKYVSKSKNLDLFTSKTDEFFKQELSIYDIIQK